MVERDTWHKARGENCNRAERESNERQHLLSFLQAIAHCFSDRSYTVDPTYQTIVVHPGKYQQTQDDHLATYLRLLLDSTDEGIYVLNLEGRCTFSNRASAQLLGYRPADILGQNMHQLIHHSYDNGSPYPVSLCPIFRAFQDDHGVWVDTEVLWRRDGTAFPVEYSSYPISEHGQIQGAVVTFRDITRRKQAELALRESEKRKAAILDAALDAMITMDHQGAILEFNPAAERMFGYQRAEVLGQELASLIIPPSLREQHRQGLAACVASGNDSATARRVELVAMRADGCEFRIELSITQISYAGPPLFTAFIRDLAEREQAITKEREHIAQQLHDSLEQILGTSSSMPAQAPDFGLHASSEWEPAIPNGTLTEREHAVLTLMVLGAGSNRELAAQLGVSESTIRYHVGNILKKFQLQNRTQVVAYAIRQGLATPPHHPDKRPESPSYGHRVGTNLSDRTG